MEARPGRRALWRMSGAQRRSLLGHPDFPGDFELRLPAGIRVVKWLPSQIRVLRHPKLALIVTHGGFNTVHEAIVARAPMLVMSTCFDQFGIGSRVTQLGMFAHSWQWLRAVVVRRLW